MAVEEVSRRMHGHQVLRGMHQRMPQLLTELVAKNKRPGPHGHAPSTWL
jgi:hypothetical protein